MYWLSASQCGIVTPQIRTAKLYRELCAWLSASQGLLCRTSNSNAAKAELQKSSKTQITPVTIFSVYCYLASASRLALNGGSRFFSLPVLPFFSSLLASSVSSHIYCRDSLCTALQTGKLWIWSTGLSAQLIPSSQGEVWVLGNPFVPTGRSRPDIRGMHGRGGKSYVWRLFPWRTLRISTFSAPW